MERGSFYLWNDYIPTNKTATNPVHTTTTTITTTAAQQHTTPPLTGAGGEHDRNPWGIPGEAVQNDAGIGGIRLDLS